jgi:hypothetical protein
MPRSIASRSTIWRCSRLRHRRVIGSNDQQHEVDAGRARYQAVDENARDRAHPKAKRADP